MTSTTRMAAALALVLAQSAVPYAQQVTGTSARAVPPPPDRPIPTVLPGTSDAAFTTIHGNALDSTDRPLPETVMRLRDTRSGRIVETQATDKTGLFTFRAVDPGSYVVELMGRDMSVLAASQMLNVNAGDTATAVVKLPYKMTRLNGLLGRSVASALAVTASAAAAGVLAATSTTDVSGERPPAR